MRLSGLLRLAALLQAAALGMRTGLPQAGPTARRVVLRRALGAAGGAAAAALGSAAPAEASLEGTDWPLWPALPLAPYGQRKTVFREAVPGKVWTFDQMLGVFYVHVPIRMTVVAMEQGGLFVYAPVAPTAELRAMLQPLVDAHGPVKHVVLPSVAPEHKVLAGPFARTFPKADFWVSDQQYAFPLNLPPSWLGLPGKINVLPTSSEGSAALPWGNEFDHSVLTAKASKESVYQEAAFFHRPTKTLMLCDSIISVTAEPPEILTSEPEYRRALLYHARDDPLEKVFDTPETRRKGWMRIALFGNFFMPGTLRMLDSSVWIDAASRSPMPELGWGGVLPFTWTADTPRAFARFSQDGAPLVAPIIQIILSRAPGASKAWANQVMSWDFERVIPAHFDAPIAATPATLRPAFNFLAVGTNEVRYCDEDIAFLRDALDGLPPDLALLPTPLGPLRGTPCDTGKYGPLSPAALEARAAKYGPVGS